MNVRSPPPRQSPRPKLLAVLIVEQNVNTLQLAHKKEKRRLKGQELPLDVVPAATDLILVLALVEEQRHPGVVQAWKFLGRLFPDRAHHSHAGVTLPVNKTEGEVTRVYVHLPRGHEDGLEADALLANIAL